jgi:hypothetical protein
VAGAKKSYPTNTPMRIHCTLLLAIHPTHTHQHQTQQPHNQQ